MFSWLWRALAAVNVGYIFLISWINQSSSVLSQILRAELCQQRHFYLIGDDLAFGAGDYNRLGSPAGIARHLRDRMLKETKLKHVWQFYNKGIVGSTSRDWTEGAEIVIVVVGLNDSNTSSTERPISPHETVQNIKSICRVLRNLGKEVWLCTTLSQTRGGADDSRARNEGILEYLKSGDDGVRPGPRLDDDGYDLKSADFFSADKLLLTNKGYLKIAKDLADEMTTVLVKREFAVIRKQLGL
ncbi:hypothetical protein HDU82_006558 [Entophlyctis luteolus]|nr:hypothetical protein HDU82_006558 [Entophlyctis luteolus]KAJ3390002.1 hypothetical protein HDU84_008061 [Entophlyctis sp. JEL0112]